MSACAGLATPTCLPGAWFCDRHAFEADTMHAAARKIVDEVLTNAVTHNPSRLMVNVSIAREIAERIIKETVTTLAEKTWP